jgi:hypothetical protein
MMKGILLITSIVLLTTTLFTGCQQQTENFTGPPPGFMAYPNTTYSFNIVFNTTPELVPGSYYLHFYHNFEGEGYGSGWIQVTVE